MGVAVPTPQPADEQELVRLLRCGDRAAFGALVQRHGGGMLRLARSLVRSAAVAEEVVQDAWLAALDAVAGFEGRSSLRTWLFRIVVNKARSRAEREGRSVPFSALGPAEGDDPAVGADRFAADGHWREPVGVWRVEDPERLALGAETQAAIQAAIGLLPEGQRAVLTLRDVEGLEAEEICRLLDITLTNQRVLLHRARARVRAALAEHLEGEGR